jgi:hypothetical protein
MTYGYASDEAFERDTAAADCPSYLAGVRFLFLAYGGHGEPASGSRMRAARNSLPSSIYPPYCTRIHFFSPLNFRFFPVLSTALHLHRNHQPLCVAYPQVTVQ